MLLTLSHLNVEPYLTQSLFKVGSVLHNALCKVMSAGLHVTGVYAFIQVFIPSVFTLGTAADWMLCNMLRYMNKWKVR